MHKKIIWPDNKKFAFTIFDDTDRSNLKDSKIIYQYLEELGFKTTRSVWMLKSNDNSEEKGVTCEDNFYLDWLLEIKNKGYEIGYHNATSNSSKRQNTKEALDRFVKIFGEMPTVMANHSENKENIYWGPDRLSDSRKIIYNILTFFKKNKYYEGHKKFSSYFWGDYCKEYISYVRNFVFADINTLKCCPYMPYEDLKKPYVNRWFASSEGNNVKMFNKCISDENQDRLEIEGGACIMYTHFADGFCKNGRLSEEFKKQMKRLSNKNGWFVPVSVLLEFLKKENKKHIISFKQRSELEWKWLFDKLVMGST
jgi:hypothetical protein|tara:strand:+ start:114 stop:1046 length:933 start_codon:yes stop_codon:yes gene_type:complete